MKGQAGRVRNEVGNLWPPTGAGARGPQNGTRPGRSRARRGGPDQEGATTLLNPDYEGRTLHSVLEHRVTEEELVAFADAVGETHPACRDADAAHRLGHPAVIAPPTYPASLALRAERPLFDDPGLGADHRSLRHRDTAVTAHRPVRAGDVLRCTVRVVSVEALGRAGLLVTEVTVEASGEPVAVVRNTVVTGPG